MKKLLYALGALAAAAALWSCDDDDSYVDYWTEYASYREANEEWLAEQEKLTNDDGTPYYERLVPAWDQGSYILIHWFNDRSETAGNLQPYLTSTVTTKYIGYLYNGTEFDSSVDNNDEGTFTTAVNGVIDGRQIALQNMHVGDTVQILVPYASAYGAQESGDIKPYSALRFNMRLTDVDDLVVKP